MKTNKILALIMALAVGLTTLSAMSITALTAENTKVIMDTNDNTSITKAGFTPDEKNVKTTKYSAKWAVDTGADKTIKGFPTDISQYNTINFTMKIESKEEATIMVFFGSENSATDGIDYYSKALNFKPGEWQTVALKYSDLKPNRTPLGWSKLSDLAFKTTGWSNKAASGTIVYIENIYLSGSPAGAGAPVATAAPAASAGSTEENAANKTKVFYYGNYDDKNAGISAGASVMPKSNSITQDFDSGDNGFVNISVTGETDDCYLEASLKSTKVNNLVVEAALSTNSQAPSGNLQYKDTSTARKQGTLFSIGGNGEITFNGDSSKKVAATLKKGTWVKLGFLINFEKKQYTAYVDGKQFGTFGAADTLNDIGIMRLYINKSASNVGKSLLLDNFAVYGGTEFRDVSKEYVAPPAQGAQTGGKIAPKVGQDVAMKHPSLDDLKGGIALMVDRPEAYAKGARTKVDTTNDAVVPVVVDDRTLVPVRFIAESFDAKVDWVEAEGKVIVSLDGKTIELVIGSNQMIVNGTAQTIDVPATTINDRTMLPLRALVESLGKNVLWDDRGLILITNSDVKLDAQKDIKLSTMIIGELVNGITASNYAAVPSFTQAIIDEAVASTPGSWQSNNGNSSSAEKSANIMYYLTLAVRADPQAAATNGTLCKDAVIKQVRHLISGGKEPFACVGPYWGHAVVAAAMVLIKNTPEIYNELTADDKDRMDWMMRALAIAGNWGFNDANNYSTGFDLMGNFGKGWNPNYRNTYLTVVLSASMYFGAEELDKIYTSFDYDAYIKKYTDLGFTNVLATWTVAGKDLMEKGGKCTLLGGIGLSRMEAGQPGGDGKGVKIPFLYNGKGPAEIQYIFKSLVDYTYSYEVLSEYGTPGADDHARILSGKKSPFEGQMGMMREFAGGDGGSGIPGTSTIRSRCGYGYDSYEILVAVYGNMKLFGGWDSSTDEMAKLDSRIYVGNEDLIFKMQEGYYGFSSGKGSNEYEYNYVSRGHKFVKDIWRNFHGMSNEKVTVTSPDGAVAVVEAPKAEPKDGVTQAPASAFSAVLLPTAGGFDASSFYPVGKNLTSGSVEFDVVMGSAMTADGSDVVVLLEKKQTGLGWSSSNMLIQFKDGMINVRNATDYKPTKLQFGANYRFHFKVDFDVATKKYTVAITPTYPTAGETVVLTDNAFRTGANAIDLVDSIVVVKSNEQSVIWVENFKVN